MDTDRTGLRCFDLLGPFRTRDDVAARLGISSQAVAAMAARRELLRVVTRDGVDLYPAWQFTETGVLVGLAEVLALFPQGAVDGWTLAGWLRTPEPELSGSPYEMLSRGEVARVLTVARAAARALTA